jgi:hypothetical protein
MRGLTAVGTRLLHPRGLRVLGDGVGGVRNWHNGRRQAQGGKSSKSLLQNSDRCANSTAHGVQAGAE